MSVACNPLHFFAFTSLTTIISTVTPATNLSQPKCHYLSIKGNPDVFTSHTNTSYNHPFLNPTFLLPLNPMSLFWRWLETPPELRRKSSTHRGSKKSALNRIDTLFTNESKKNDFKIIYIVNNVRIPKYLDLEWFFQQGFNFPNMLEAQGLSKLVRMKGTFYPELVKVFYTCARTDLEGNLFLLLMV